MSRPMNMREFADVINHIRNHNAPFTGKYPLPIVKYIDPHIDMRTDTVFSIVFRTMSGGEKVLHCQNECRELPDTLYTRCMAYLNGAE